MVKKHNFENEKIWITGASSGIGKAVALELSKYNPQLVLSGRNIEALKDLHALIRDPKPILIPFDVTDKKANLLAAKKNRRGNWRYRYSFFKCSNIGIF